MISPRSATGAAALFRPLVGRSRHRQIRHHGHLAASVHPRVAMAILRHAQCAITMEIYTQVSDAATRDGLKKLGDSLA